MSSVADQDMDLSDIHVADNSVLSGLSDEADIRENVPVNTGPSSICTTASPLRPHSQLLQDGSSLPARVQGDQQEHYTSHQTLPREALLLIFQLLHEQDMRLIQPCMLVCKAWRKLIVNESRFWHRLHINLDYPEIALSRALRYASRLLWASTSGPAPSSSSDARRTSHKAFATRRTQAMPNEPRAKSLLDFSVSYTNKRNKEYNGNHSAFQAHCRSILSMVMEQTRPHLSELRFLNMQITGDEQIHLDMLDDILRTQIAYESSSTSNCNTESARSSSAKRLQIVMPLVNSLPLSGNALAFFTSAEVVTIRGNWPLPPNAADTPELPQEPSPTLAGLLQYLAQNRDVSDIIDRNRNLLRRYHRYQEQYKRYRIELANHEAFCRLDELSWNKLHHPKEFFAVDSTYGKLIDVKDCHFMHLTTLNLFGCAISDTLVLPATGFPKLRSLSVTRCKWGRGLWHFLAHTPNLECLGIQYLKWNEQRDVASFTTASSVTSPAYSIPPPDIQSRTKTSSSQPSSDTSASDGETPSNQNSLSPTHETFDIVSEWNYILENSTITILGDYEHPIADFDEQGDENPNVAYAQILEAGMTYSRLEEVYKYPEQLCYPPEIDTGCSWAVISKPVVENSWQAVAGFRFCHRVYTHYDDEECIDEDFYSEYDWPELQGLRAAFRKKQDRKEGVRDCLDDRGHNSFDSSLQPPLANPNLETLECIELPKLQSLSLIGGTFKPIWIATASGLDVPIRHPGLNMPALKRIDLSGDRSLECTRISKPVPRPFAEALQCRKQRTFTDRPVHLSNNNWYAVLQQFMIGKEPVPHEASNEILLATLPENIAAEYMARPDAVLEYRRRWRIQQGLMTKTGKTEERALLALITGAFRSTAAPFSGAALMASCRTVTSLDLSYTNVSPAVFNAMLDYSDQLRHLSLAGVASLQDSDFEGVSEMCPLLRSLDISRCAPHLTPRAAVLVVDSMKQLPSVNKISRLRLDDPDRVRWGPSQQSGRQYYLSMYAYLDFLGLIVDEEVDRWLAAMNDTRIPFSKKASKRRA